MEHLGYGLVLRGRRINLILIREGSRRLLFHGDFKDGAATIRAKAESGLLMTCYHCHQLGHMRQDYPQRQGSQNYGTAQSKSLVGQARTQFVPSHLSAGQRDQYQSQGAAQVLTKKCVYRSNFYYCYQMTIT